MSNGRDHSLMGKRDEGISPAFVAVATAMGTGLSGMLSNRMTTGGAVGTAVGGLAAYVATEVTSASVTEASIIVGLAGTAGLIVAAKIDASKSLETEATGIASLPSMIGTVPGL
jgi:hypothetical protein